MADDDVCTKSMCSLLYIMGVDAVSATRLFGHAPRQRTRLLNTAPIAAIARELGVDEPVHPVRDLPADWDVAWRKYAVAMNPTPRT